jgi:hypothetical protein
VFAAELTLEETTLEETDPISILNSSQKPKTVLQRPTRLIIGAFCAVCSRKRAMLLPPSASI